MARLVLTERAESVQLASSVRINSFNMKPKFANKCAKPLSVFSPLRFWESPELEKSMIFDAFFNTSSKCKICLSPARELDFGATEDVRNAPKSVPIGIRNRSQQGLATNMLLWAFKNAPK